MVFFLNIMYAQVSLKPNQTMKLSTALAVLIAIQRHGHRMRASASFDDHERKLRINQDDAAKKVNDAVGLAKASIDAGDVHGVALPLNYVALSAHNGGEQQLTVALRLPGVDRDQHVLIDTGSSSLAFCDESLIEEAVNITKMDYAQCSKFSFPLRCPDYPHDVFRVFYVGQVFQGNIAAYDISNGKEIASMYDVNFAVMSRVQNYGCLGPLDGIIGVAYKELNDAVEIPSPEFDVVSLWEPVCETDHPYYKSVGTCNYGNLPVSKLPSPLQQSLQVGVDSGYNSVEAFGLYCDYAATIDSEKDAIVPSLGAYFGGDVALNNTFYNSGTPQIATSPKCENESAYYNLNLKAITIPGLNISDGPFSNFNQCEDVCAGNCITDSGSSYIFLPLPQSVCDGAKSMDASNLKELGPMLLDLEGVNGSTITLSLPLHWLVDLVHSGLVICTADTPTGDFILGMPIFQYYYLVYDMGNNTVTFVDLQLSNETEAFDPSSSPSKSSEPSSQPMDGPEKEPGKISEPSTGYRHTGSPSTKTFVMAGLLLLACKYVF